MGVYVENLKHLDTHIIKIKNVRIPVMPLTYKKIESHQLVFLKKTNKQTKISDYF